MKCPECNMENIEGAIFCEECGAKLEAAAVDSITMPGSKVTVLVLASPSGGKLEIPAKNEVVIGREDPFSEVFPDLDLTEFGGADGGVSRKHAVIHRTGTGCTIEDMGSTNGTYVNKKRVQPHAPQEIKPGDEVRFGKVAFSLQAA
jgi:pSer/pThr/pTyr-binding forkhead associated (FHA) protein